MDSGGPVLWQNPTTENLVLVGVINYGIGCAVVGSVNARVGAYIDWITSVTPGKHKTLAARMNSAVKKKRKNRKGMLTNAKPLLQMPFTASSNENAT